MAEPGIVADECLALRQPARCVGQRLAHYLNIVKPRKSSRARAASRSSCGPTKKRTGAPVAACRVAKPDEVLVGPALRVVALPGHGAWMNAEESRDTSGTPSVGHPVFEVGRAGGKARGARQAHVFRDPMTPAQRNATVALRSRR